MGMSSWSGSGSEGYTTSMGGGGLNPWIGWGISTLLLCFLNRNSDSGSSTSSQQPSKFTEDNVNCIGQPVPVVLGRCMIKNPMISFYGDFSSEPYTEEYGHHSSLNVWPAIVSLLLSIVAAIIIPDTVPPGQSVMTSTGGGTVVSPGYVIDSGSKRSMIVSAVQAILLWLLMQLFNSHEGRTTIQKGFLYYLGWQHIICWTGRNIGIKKLWMNVYDSKIEASTEQGVWDNDGHIAWEKDNINGITANIDDKDMFGGYDEGGGFTGQVRFYFGNRQQPKDPWMIKSMQVSTIETELRGLTPQYPMYLTCVISNSAKTGGAYIGKQATIPEMWFEVVNYASKLGDYWKVTLLEKFLNKLDEEMQKIIDFINEQDSSVQSYMASKISDIISALNIYKIEADKFLAIPYWQTYLISISAWVSGVYYNVDDIVKYNNVRYKCIEAHISSSNFNDDVSKWELLVQSSYMSWNTETDFKVGDVILYIGQIYTCTKDHKSGYSFDDENWDLFYEPYPSQNLLDDIYNKVVDAYNYYPPTDRDKFGAVLLGLEELCQEGAWELGQLGDDLNPAEAIYEILTNSYWGCNYYEERIDVDSLLELGITCEQELLGVSCLINRIAKSNDYITKILNHINAVKYDDPKTGKLTFKLIRNDYDVDKIKTFDVANTESCEFSRLDWSETTSAVDVSFTDASNKYDTGQFTYTDISNRLITGFYTSKSVEGDYFTTTSNAKWLAQMNQLANGYPLSAINLVTNRYAYDVTIGDPIKVSWEPYGLNQVVYRVTDIDYATLTDGKISITGIEDVFGFDKLDFSTSESPAWTDPKDTPTSIGRYMFLEDPYEMSHNLDTFVYAYASQPKSTDIYWNVWRKVETNYVKSSQSMSWSMIGRSTYLYPKSFDVDANGFELSMVGANGEELMDAKIDKINKYPSTYTSTSGLNLLVVDDEWMSYESIEKLPNGHYQVKGVIRGIFDTLPEQHSVESIVYFIESRQNIAGNGYAMGAGVIDTEYLELRTETRMEEQPFNVALLEEYTTTRRAERPSVMGNMKFGIDLGNDTNYNYDYSNDTIFSGNLVFKFNGRNKYNNYGIISQTDTDTVVTVSKDVKNVLQINSNGIDYELQVDAFDSVNLVNINEMEFTWEQFCEVMGSSLQYSNTVLFNVLTYDSVKDLYSYNEYEKSIEWRVPRFVGVVADMSEAQALADSYIVTTSVNTITVSETSVSPQLSMSFDECPILIEGTLSSSVFANTVKGQDGNNYILSTTAYRIVGKDANNQAILYPFTINKYYVVRTDFTELVNNYSLCYQYDGTDWVIYTIT